MAGRGRLPPSPANPSASADPNAALPFGPLAAAAFPRPQQFLRLRRIELQPGFRAPARRGMTLRARIRGVGLVGPGWTSWPEARDALAGRSPYVASATSAPSPDALPATERRR